MNSTNNETAATEIIATTKTTKAGNQSTFYYFNGRQQRKSTATYKYVTIGSNGHVLSFHHRIDLAEYLQADAYRRGYDRVRVAKITYLDNDDPRITAAAKAERSYNSRRRAAMRHAMAEVAALADHRIVGVHNGDRFNVHSEGVFSYTDAGYGSGFGEGATYHEIDLVDFHARVDAAIANAVKFIEKHAPVSDEIDAIDKTLSWDERKTLARQIIDRHAQN